jgi:hypothetical protein
MKLPAHSTFSPLQHDKPATRAPTRLLEDITDETIAAAVDDLPIDQWVDTMRWWCCGTRNAHHRAIEQTIEHRAAEASSYLRRYGDE